ncbi:7835_t:CDS:2 [Scutellospora calospora]|uniref:7835_t:CDS:1 n=1 Tax=Scutellospora calospora TaxID=85575 RepID=A0ACA9KBN8_9GLOM|nr:7835_t:CDS:2 [Scutellospora calospora]
MYDDIYNFVYHLEGSSLEKREFNAEEFIKILEQFKYDNTEFFYFVDINENMKRLERHLMKNIMKNLSAKLNTNWSAFIKDFYKCLGEMDITNFLSRWNMLKTSYLLATTYLSHMEKIQEKWAAYFNSDTFMADMITTQCGESMNNMMKGYLDANTSLTAFIAAFQSALDTQNEKTKFRVYQQNNFNIIYKTTSIFERQAASILTTFAFKKIQEQLMQSFIYKLLSRSLKFKDMKQKQVKELHIFRIAMQLNLEELLARLFYNRWKKNLSKEEIINNYIVFSTSTSQQSTTFSNIELNNDQNYQYLLTQLLQKIQRFILQNPTTAATLYNSFNEKFVSEIEKISISQSNNLITSTIKNPLIVHGKGHLSNKRILSTVELASNKKKKTSKNKENILESQECINLNNDQPSYIRPLDKIQHSNIIMISSQGQDSDSPIQQLPEYYGTKGLAVILKTLTEMFVQTKILTANICSPQSSSQYLAQVLIPETAIRLIAEDFNNISLDMAKEIMIDSVEFGLYVYDDSN